MPLKREDYLSLIRQVKEKEDPPIGKSIAEVTFHWQTVKHRLNRFLTDDIFPGTSSTTAMDPLSKLAFTADSVDDKQAGNGVDEGVSLTVEKFEI